jgi:hypothetical protein
LDEVIEASKGRLKGMKEGTQDQVLYEFFGRMPDAKQKPRMMGLIVFHEQLKQEGLVARHLDGYKDKADLSIRLNFSSGYLSSVLNRYKRDMNSEHPWRGMLVKQFGLDIED